MDVQIQSDEPIDKPLIFGLSTTTAIVLALIIFVVLVFALKDTQAWASRIYGMFVPKRMMKYYGGRSSSY